MNYYIVLHQLECLIFTVVVISFSHKEKEIDLRFLKIYHEIMKHNIKRVIRTKCSTPSPSHFYDSICCKAISLLCLRVLTLPLPHFNNSVCYKSFFFIVLTRSIHAPPQFQWLGLIQSDYLLVLELCVVHPHTPILSTPPNII